MTAIKHSTELLAELHRMDDRKAISEAVRSGFRMDRIVEAINDGTPRGERRMDDTATGTLSRQLLYLRAQTIDVEYAKCKARELVRVKTDIPWGADSYSVPQWDIRGQAELITNGADDLPGVDAFISEDIRKGYTFGVKFEYTVQDLRRIAFSGQPIDAKRMLAARTAWETRFDAIAATGHTGTSMSGLANATGVNVISLSAAGTWAAKIAANNQLGVVNDLNALCNAVFTQTLENHAATKLALSLESYTLLASTPWNATNASNYTILDYFVDNSPWIKDRASVIPWNRLKTADNAGTGPRAIAYDDSQEVVEITENPFEMLAPQARNLGFIVPCQARTFGVCVYRPLAITYMDGI